MNALAVALGGALGAPARVALERLVTGRLGHRFPWGTLLVNLAGSFALGMLVGHVSTTTARAAAGTGFLGAFTTFSTYAYEIVRLDERGDRSRAVVYAVVTVVGGTALAWAGLATA